MYVDLPLACSDSYRRGAIRWAWLFTCPHLYLHFIQELHKRESSTIQYTIDKICIEK